MGIERLFVLMFIVFSIEQWSFLIKNLNSSVSFDASKEVQYLLFTQP